jgi:allophanate hydrolase
MSTARFKVVFAGPLVSFQDVGRIGHLRFGVGESGPMDRFAHTAAQAMVGNKGKGSTIEVSLGGLILECTEGETSIAVAGGGFAVQCGALRTTGWTTQTIRQGDKLTLRAGDWGSWAYVAFAGQLVLESWLGATSTHSMSGFGAGALHAGLEFTVENAELRESRNGDIPCPALATASLTPRVVIGPQDQHFDPQSVETFCTEPFTLSDAFDRMGVRLNGPDLSLKNALSIPSEPIVRGSVQVSGDGVPTVLLADNQTTGGYPKIATVISSDVDRLAQLRAGDTVRFRAITPEDAIKATRTYHAEADAALAEIAAPKASLEERLQNLNLIGGVVTAQDAP